jgi:hypothetical protein
MLTARSVQGVQVRLTEERWRHIVAEHPDLRLALGELLDVVTRPDSVVEGPQGELLAVRATDAGKWLIVVYRIGGADGFVITAFSTCRRKVFERRRQLWP